MPDFLVLRREQLAAFAAIEAAEAPEAAVAVVEARNLPEGEYVAISSDAVQLVRVAQRTIYVAEAIDPESEAES